MGATQDKGKHGEAAFMVLWRHVGTWVAWRARGRDVWMPGGPTLGSRLGWDRPVFKGTSSTPYLHSFLLHPLLIYIIFSDIMHDFELLILRTDSILRKINTYFACLAFQEFR